MMDDGLGSAVYHELTTRYCFSDNVEIVDLGAMTLAELEYIKSDTYAIAVDAFSNLGVRSGTVVRLQADDLAKKSKPFTSLHELSLRDLFEAAKLVGEKPQGVVLGMQVENAKPGLYHIGLSAKVEENLLLLVDAVVDEIVTHGGVVWRN